MAAAAAALALGCAVETGARGGAPVTPPAAGLRELREAFVEPLRVDVVDGVVFVDGSSVGTLAPGPPERSGALFTALAARAERSQVPAQERGYVLSVSGQLDAARLEALLETAAAAGWPFATLATEHGPVRVHGAVRTIADATHLVRSAPHEVVVVLVVKELTYLQRLLRLPNGARGEPEFWGHLGAGWQGAASLSAAVDEECRRAPCDSALVVAAPDASVAAVMTALAALARNSGQRPLEVAVVSRAGEPYLETLTPEQVQAVIRGANAKLRRCYEAGLARDAGLEGKVTARVRIDGTGAVVEASAVPVTTMPDEAVTECVLREFRALAFPRPTKGPVVIVYPIRFSGPETDAP